MMKKYYFLILTLLYLTLFTSCRKNDNQAFLEAINQTSCSQKVFDGVNSNNGDFLGTVGANQTKTFTIELGSSESIKGEPFSIFPVNCSGSTAMQYHVDITAGHTSRIVIQ